MKHLLWCAVAALVIVLQVDAQEIPRQANFDIDQFVGKWHVVEGVMRAGEVRNKLSHYFMWRKESNGNVRCQKIYPQKKNCRNIEFLLRAAGEPGDYRSPSGTDVRVVETDYTNYAVMSFQTNGNWLLTSSLHLYTRRPEPTTEQKARLVTYAENLGFDVDSIYEFDPNDSCP